MSRYDIAIIGAGIAGASLAAEIAPHASVLILEAEAQPGYHSTGRSAAFLSETYGGPLVQPLTAASRSWLEVPPAEMGEESFLGPRGALHIAEEGGAAALDAMLAAFPDVGLEALGREALEARVPGLRPGWNRAVWEPSCADVDVARLHAAYLGIARRSGAALKTDARLVSARRGERWRLDTAAGGFEAEILVDAGGAWADPVAEAAAVRPIGIAPHRRTIAQVRVAPSAPAGLPLVIDARGRFYFKPEAGGRLWLSPHDETPCAPGDCAAEEYEVALAIDRMEQAVDWRVERVERAWAGLRSFAPDRLPVYGFAADAPGFFWFAGQGGFGIQTAPAAAKLAAALLLGRNPDPIVAAIDAAPYDPRRFMN